MRLSDAEEPIRAALARLLEKPRAHRPFVVVEDTVTRRFVQFAGSDGERLLFDVPALAVSARAAEDWSAEQAAQEGARMAVTCLRRDLHLPAFAELRIDEGVQTDPSKRS